MPIKHAKTSTAPGSGDSSKVQPPDWNADHVGSNLTQSYLGYNTIGSFTENVTNNRVYLKKITIPVAGLLTSIGAYISQSTDHVFGLSAALFEDNAGVPGKIMYYNMNPAD